METLNPGTVVRLRGGSSWWGSSLATLISDEGSTVIVMTDAGRLCCAKGGVDFSVCRNQSPLPEPMRSRLPYGKWTCSSGREVLFNRNYEPIWSRTNSKAKTISADRAEWVEHDSEEHFYKDGNPPWRDKETLRRCEQILKSWGIA